MYAKYFLHTFFFEIFSNLIQTLISEARVLNPKACGVHGAGFTGAAPVGIGGQALHQFFFFSRMDKMFFKQKKFRSVHIYMTDAECAETNEKSIFSF